jgi:MFS family permease
MTSSTVPPQPVDRPRSLFHNADFRRLFAADSVSKVGTQISYLAIPLVAIHALNANVGQVGLLGALGSVAFLVIGLPAGAWVERMRRRRVMVIADLIRAVLMASVPIAWALNVLSMPQLYLVVLLVGVGTVFFDVAAGSYLPHLVGRDHLLEANAKMSSVSAGAEVAGRSGGGFLVQLFSAPVAVVINAGTYLWSALCLGFIRMPEPKLEPAADRHLGREVMQGLRFVFGLQVLRIIAIETSWSNLCLRMIITLIPVLFVTELTLSDGWVGIFLATGGVGVFLGSMVARRLGTAIGYGRTLWIIGASCGPFALLVPLTDTGVMLWVALGGWLVTTFKVGVDNVIKASLRQRISPDNMLSRMGATYRFMITGALAIGSVAAGVLGDATTVRTALWVAAIGMAMSWVLLFFSPVRQIRELPDVADPP